MEKIEHREADAIVPGQPILNYPKEYKWCLSVSQFEKSKFTNASEIGSDRRAGLLRPSPASIEATKKGQKRQEPRPSLNTKRSPAWGGPAGTPPTVPPQNANP